MLQRAEIDNPIAFLIKEPQGKYREQAIDNLSSHALADFRRCPRLFHQKLIGEIGDEDRPAYAVGRAVHVMALEGEERFHEEFAVGGPINPKTGNTYGPATKAFTEWAETQDRDVLSDSQFDLVSRMVEGIDDHRRAQELLAAGIAEGVVRVEYQGMPCQGRLDWYTGREIVDLKTVEQLEYFPADARRFGYPHQIAFYRSLVREASGTTAACFFIVVEKKPPFRVGVWRILDHVLDEATAQNEAAIARLKRCIESDEWPTLYEEEQMFDFA